MFEDIYDLSDDPTPEQTETVMAAISKKVREGKKRIYPNVCVDALCSLHAHNRHISGDLKDLVVWRMSFLSLLACLSHS